MKKALFVFIAILIFSVSLFTIITYLENNKQIPNADDPKVEIITEKDKMLEAFAVVNKAMPKINKINKGRITSNFSGYFMLAGIEVKEETIIERTQKGIRNQTTVTYSDGTTQLFEAVSDKTVSEIVHMQWYPNEEIERRYFDNAEKVTVTREKDSIAFKIDWKQDERKASPSIYLQYLYSHITVDKNGYITDWSFYAKSY